MRDVVPHMGWNTVAPAQDSRMFADLPEDARFYFVHSYAVHAWELRSHHAAMAAPRVTWAEHGGLSSPPWRTAPLWATQFHPEKSGDAGAQLLTNWIETL